MGNTNKHEEEVKAYIDGREGRPYEKPNSTLDHIFTPQGEHHRQMIETDHAASKAFDRGRRDRERG